jgi:sugar phosphate isomerase/epimerase
MPRPVKIGMPVLMEYDNILSNILLAKELKLDFIELNINMLYCKVTNDLRQELLNYKKDYDIDFSLHYYDTVDISSDSKHYRNYLYQEFSEIGKHLEGIISRIIIHLEPGAYMTIHSEKNYVYKSDPLYVERSLNTLITIREILHTFGIGVFCENVPIHPFQELLYQTLNEHGFMFCYDIGHNVIYNNYLYESFRTKYNLTVKHMHMHNVYNKKDHQELSKGEIYIPMYLEYAIKHQIDIVVEVKDIANLKKSIKFIDDYFDSRDQTRLLMTLD